jgi:hypothetical protein
MVLFTKKGQSFQIDDCDFEKVSHLNWYTNPFGYITTRKNDSTIFLHIFLFGYAAKGLEWDHLNRDKTDNRKENLRQVTHVVNQRNHNTRRDSKSGIRGVIQTSKYRWLARIGVSSVYIYLGYYNTKEEAIKARLAGEKKYWGTER